VLNKHAGQWEAKLSLGLFDTTDEALGVPARVQPGVPCEYVTDVG
jgi:hypothetical protein